MASLSILPVNAPQRAFTFAGPAESQNVTPSRPHVSKPWAHYEVQSCLSDGTMPLSRSLGYTVVTATPAVWRPIVLLRIRLWLELRFLSRRPVHFPIKLTAQLQQTSIYPTSDFGSVWTELSCRLHTHHSRHVPGESLVYSQQRCLEHLRVQGSLVQLAILLM